MAERGCPRCGTATTPDQQFCTACGAALLVPAPLDAAAATHLEATPPAARPKRPGRLLVAGAVALVAVLAVGGFALSRRTSPPPAQAGGTPSASGSATGAPAGSTAGALPGASASPVPLAPADIARLQTALVAQQPSAVAPALATALRDGYLAHPVSLLPAGATLTVVPGSEQYASATSATVDVAAAAAAGSGGKAGRHRLYLLYEQGEWLVYATESVS